MASALAIQAPCQASRNAKIYLISMYYEIHAAKIGGGQEPIIAFENCDSLNSCAAHKK
jgi:hypothetical protein